MKMSLHCVVFVLITSASAGQALKLNGPDPNKAITQYIQEVWQIEQGLPQNSVEAIQQTRDGFLWLGTQEGLVRFDGVQFTVFDKSNTPQIKNNHIVSLCLDKAGTLWIATMNEGVVTFDGRRFHAVTIAPQLIGTQLRHLYLDNKGGMWVSTRDSGAVRIDSVSVRHRSTGTGLISNNVWSVAEDIKGRMWFATNKGISVEDGDSVYSFTENDGISSQEIYSLLGNHSGEMFAGGHNGLQRLRLSGNRLTVQQTFTPKDGMPGTGVYELITDQQGSIWIGGSDGIARYYKGAVSAFTDKHGLSQRLIGSLFVDREGNLWVGTDGGGLNVFRDGIFTSYTVKEGLPNNVVWTIFEDRQKNLWFGTDEGLALFRQESGVKKVFHKKDGLSHGLIWSITQDADGAVWVGSMSGLNKIVNGKIVSLPRELQFDSIPINCVYTDPSGTIWVGTAEKGLYTITRGVVERFGASRGLANKFINVVTSDRRGNIVIGTDGDGLYIVNRDTVLKRYTTADGLSSNYIYSLYVDSSNNLWSGTLGEGLSIFDGTSFHRFSVKNGMFDDVVFQIIEDDFQRMWFSCNRGVFQISRKKFFDVIRGTASAVTYTAYGKENGMGSSECNGGSSPAGWKSGDGKIWFPTLRGVAMVNPKNISINMQPPLVVVEKLVVDNDPVNGNDSIVVPSGPHRYEFHYTGLSFDGPKKVRFKVKLEGYDTQWDDVQFRRTAYYTYLPAGEYTFKVIAANSDGVWTEEPATLRFTVEANFYESTLFLSGMTVILAFCLFGFYRWRIKRIHIREVRLKKAVEEATRSLSEANEAKSQLLSFVAHDLKTPVITINSIAQEIKTFNVDKHFRGYLDLVEQNSKRIVTLISEILNITAIETGKVQFTKEPVNMSDIAGMVVDGYKIHALRKDQSLKYSTADNDSCMVNADAGKLQEAMENLISNAIKYSPRGAEIRVSVERINETVRFAVVDQGPGISDEDKSQLFKKFTVLSAKPTGGEIATGLGLAIVKDIIDAHGGSITVESTPPLGTTFTIELRALQAEA